MGQTNIKIFFPFLRQQMQRWASQRKKIHAAIHPFKIFIKSRDRKNAKRFAETFKNYASYIHTFKTIISKTSEKKGKKIKNLVLEAVFRRCSIKKIFLKISQNSQKNTCTKQKQPFRGVLEKRCCENMQPILQENTHAEVQNRTLACVFSCKFAAYFLNNFS